MKTSAVLLVAALSVTAASAHDNDNDRNKPKREPLVLQEQGTFYVGGNVEYRAPASTTDPNDPRSQPGNWAFNQMFVEYQVPAKKKYKYPIVFLHGGGHTGQFYRTTPDGRDGWYTSFTRRGFSVYALDAPNRGRAGWDPTKRMQATLGQIPASQMEPTNIYTEQSAWTAFRWGPQYGVKYPNSQFPYEAMGQYLRQIQAAYRDPAQNPAIAADIGALIDKIGPCILVGWSTGTGNVLVGATSSPQRIKNVKGIIGLEGFPPATGNAPDPAKLAKIPFLGLLGDNMSPDSGKAYTDNLNSLGGNARTVFLPDVGMRGNGHTMALEKNNEKIADLIENWIERNVEKDGPGRGDDDDHGHH
jgi:pimeloyl-ACP methyl ester carboxylesterase